MSEQNREELERELADLEAKNAEATGWGAAVGARHERIMGIRKALAVAPAQCAPNRDDLALAIINAERGRYSLPLLEPSALTDPTYDKHKRFASDALAYLAVIRTPAACARVYGQPPAHWTPEDKYDRHPRTADEWDPRKDPVGSKKDLADRRINFAMDLDDPDAPAEMAIVSRWDLMALMHDLIHKRAAFESYGAMLEENKRLHAQVEKLTDLVNDAPVLVPDGSVTHPVLRQYLARLKTWVAQRDGLKLRGRQ